MNASSPHGGVYSQAQLFERRANLVPKFLKVTAFFRGLLDLHIPDPLQQGSLHPVHFQPARLVSPLAKGKITVPARIQQTSPGYLSDHAVVLLPSILPSKTKERTGNEKRFPP